MAESSTRSARIRRHKRVREKIAGTRERPRLCVFRSLNQIYTQVIDDSSGNTIAAVSSIDPDVKAEMEGKKKTAQADIIGATIAKKAAAKGITEVVFDRGGYKYHGRVKALAEAARKGGLKF
jgi:large subunit ribosomal protein L18